MALCLSQGVTAQSDVTQAAVANCKTGMEVEKTKTNDLRARLAAKLAELSKPQQREAAPAQAPARDETPAGGEASAVVAAAAVAEQRRVKDAIALVEAAATAQAQAQAKLETVSRARNPAEAQVALRESQRMAEYARTITRQAEAISAPRLEPAGGPAPRPGSPIQPRLGTAFAEALRADRLLSADQPGAAVYDGSQLAGWDERTAQIQLQDGKRLDVRPLLQSFRQVAGPRVPLFRNVPSPSPGQQPGWRLSDEAVREIRDPGKRARLDQVGGVDLSITLDLLEFNELEDFRKPGPALIVERPVLISLKQLVTDAGSYASRWDALPERLRFPGSIERIVGFVIDRDRGDMVLVGVPASLATRRIDVDALIVGVRTAWLEGQVPSVSLDPLPQNPGGPQFTQVSGVPRNSRFARIMIEDRKSVV